MIHEEEPCDLLRLRHSLHQCPELGDEEHRTADAIRAALNSLRIAHARGPDSAPTATIATIGNASNPCIALRADIDALPITERTELPYASRNDGRMHACGHDGHIATLVGAAAALRDIADQLPVCVKLIFQPAEEGGAGAQRLVEAGVLDGRLGPRVRAIFGLHGWPALPVGSVATRPGAIMAATDNFEATFIGKGCHGAFPHLGRDPIPAAAGAILSLQQVVSRDLDPTDPAVVTVGQVQAGTAVNIIPDRAWVAGTSRTLTDSARQLAHQAIRRRCIAAAEAGGCQLDFQWHDGYPATINDPAMADYVARIARQALGAERFLPVARPSMGGEDFAYYLQQVPGCFFFLGVRPEGRSDYPPLHSDRYDFADEAMQTGIRMFVELASNFAV